jgi:chromosome segregation ATPase
MKADQAVIARELRKALRRHEKLDGEVNELTAEIQKRDTEMKALRGLIQDYREALDPAVFDHATGKAKVADRA